MVWPALEPPPTRAHTSYATSLPRADLAKLEIREATFDDADLSDMARSFYADNKRVRNERIKKELGVVLRYPGYREGMVADLSES